MNIKESIHNYTSYIYMVAFTFLYIEAKSQNLVQNSSFELYKKNRCGFIAKNLDGTYDNISNYIFNWYAPTNGTTDFWYFDASSPRFRNGNDCAAFIIEYDKLPIPHSGNGFIGLYITNSVPGINFPDTENYREYASTKLDSVLKKDYYYNLTFYARLNYNSKYCSNKLGALLSKDSVTHSSDRIKNSTGPLLYNPQVLVDEYVCEPGKWVKITKCIKAEGGEQFLTIGNFYDDNNTTVQPTNILLPGGVTNAYYFIDDVSLEEVASYKDYPVANFLGHDTTICAHTTLTLRTPSTGNGIKWSTGDTNSTYEVISSGNYMVSANYKGCTVQDTVNVNVLPELLLPNDTVFCEEESITIVLPSQLYNLHWFDKTSDHLKKISQSGVYWITDNSYNCFQSDTIKVEAIKCPGTIPNVFTPNNDGINDRFRIENIEYGKWELSVFNRYGKKVYYTEKYGNEWGGENCPYGLYYYLLNENEKKITFKGWVQIIR